MQHKKLPVEKYHQIFCISFLSQVICDFQRLNPKGIWYYKMRGPGNFVQGAT